MRTWALLREPLLVPEGEDRVMSGVADTLLCTVAPATTGWLGLHPLLSVSHVAFTQRAR